MNKDIEDKNLGYFFNTTEYLDSINENKLEKRKKMLKILALGGFIGGLLTSIVSYTCDFFGIDFGSTKDEIVSTESEGENK